MGPASCWTGLLLRNALRENDQALDAWAGWAARRDTTYRLGRTRRAALRPRQGHRWAADPAVSWVRARVAAPPGGRRASRRRAGRVPLRGGASRHRATRRCTGGTSSEVAPSARCPGRWPTPSLRAPSGTGRARSPPGYGGDAPGPDRRRHGQSAHHVPEYRSSVALHGQLPSSKLITLKGADRDGLYGDYGNACVDSTVNRYLLTGTLSADDQTCAK
ncbi:alpha/beta hydrolase [Streptomyces sp. NPDC052496]|uniref:alpha/beta hydrolase n=1 Tax=Streptomyces sp. NPDC052496 TaxID=3154951 RepID=UPI003417EAEA